MKTIKRIVIALSWIAALGLLLVPQMAFAQPFTLPDVIKQDVCSFPSESFQVSHSSASEAVFDSLYA